jgi:enterochelin esterase-like enzyme
MKHIFFALSFICGLSATFAQSSKTLTLVTESFESKSLKGNLVRENTLQSMNVYLPDSYFRSSIRYPVVYYFHGFGAGFNSIDRYIRIITEAFVKKDREIIIVAVNGSGALGGTFWTDSPVTGKWESIVPDEIVPFIDKKYRTIAKPSKRGLAGFSMGGFGAINIGMNHPDVFSSIYACAPGLLKNDRFGVAFEQWKKFDPNFFEPYGAAFAPDTELPFPHAAIPVMDGSQKDNRIIEKWLSGFGDIERKAASYASKRKEFNTLRIDYMKGDRYVWIPEGCRYMSEKLKALGIPHIQTEYPGGHSMTDNVMTQMIEYFQDTLFRN